MESVRAILSLSIYASPSLNRNPHSESDLMTVLIMRSYLASLYVVHDLRRHKVRTFSGDGDLKGTIPYRKDYRRVFAMVGKSFASVKGGGPIGELGCTMIEFLALPWTPKRSQALFKT